MLVKFTSPECANILYFGDVARRLLSLMGLPDTVPGALHDERVPAALTALRAALALRGDELAPPARTEDDEPAVSLAHRALPLLDMLDHAARTEKYVMWEEA